MSPSGKCEFPPDVDQLLEVSAPPLHPSKACRAPKGRAPPDPRAHGRTRVTDALSPEQTTLAKALMSPCVPTHE